MSVYRRLWVDWTFKISNAKQSRNDALYVTFLKDEQVDVC